MVIFDPQPRGLKTITHLAGLGGSSTRMELAAAIMVTAASGPTHIGTDSQSFLSKASYVSDLVRAQQQPKSPWALHRNGDLWHQYHKQVLAKGATSIAISKVKGHSTQP